MGKGGNDINRGNQKESVCLRLGFQTNYLDQVQTDFVLEGMNICTLPV